MKKHFSNVLDMFMLSLPAGWVLTCYDGGWQKFQDGYYLKFSWHLICGCFVAFVLIGFGSGFSGLEINNTHESERKGVRLAILLGILFVFTTVVLK